MELATMLLGGALQIASLAGKAIEAWQAGDEVKAFRLLDEAITLSDKVMPAARAELEAVRTRVAEAIAKKFDGGA